MIVQKPHFLLIYASCGLYSCIKRFSAPSPPLSTPGTRKSPSQLSNYLCRQIEMCSIANRVFVVVAKTHSLCQNVLEGCTNTHNQRHVLVTLQVICTQKPCMIFIIDLFPHLSVPYLNCKYVVGQKQKFSLPPFLFRATGRNDKTRIRH